MLAMVSETGILLTGTGIFLPVFLTVSPSSTNLGMLAVSSAETTA